MEGVIKKKIFFWLFGGKTSSRMTIPIKRKRRLDPGYIYTVFYLSKWKILLNRWKACSEKKAREVSMHSNINIFNLACSFIFYLYSIIKFTIVKKNIYGIIIMHNHSEAVKRYKKIKVDSWKNIMLIKVMIFNKKIKQSNLTFNNKIIIISLWNFFFWASFSTIEQYFPYAVYLGCFFCNIN